MTTTRSANEIWLIGNPKSDLDASCSTTNGGLLRSCVPFSSHFQKSKCHNKWCCKATIEAVTEI